MRRIEADQIAVMSIHYQFYPLTRFLDTARRLNVSAVDLWAGYPHLLLDNDWESAARAVRAAADDRGLRIICCTPEQVRYPLNLASTEPKVRARTLEYLKRGVDAAGNALEARFPLEAVITGGQENGEVPQLLLMDFRAGDGAWIEAGEEATLSLTLVNQSATRAVENIAIVFAESTGGLLPARSDTVRVSRLAAGESALVEIPIRAAMDAEPRAHSVEIRAQGAYGAGKDTSVAEKFTVDVRQSVRFAHSEAALPVRVTQGDVSSFTITLMNMGKSPLSNALLTFDVPGLASGGSVLAGDLAPGESKDATANFRVSSDEALVGPVSGTVTLSYEDAYGEYYETSLPLSTTIEKKAPLAAASADEEEEAAPFPYLPWSLFAAALIALIVLQTLARRRIRALEERGL